MAKKPRLTPQKNIPNKKVALFDFEHAYDVKYAEKLGIAIDDSETKVNDFSKVLQESDLPLTQTSRLFYELHQWHGCYCAVGFCRNFRSYINRKFLSAVFTFWN